MLRYTTDRARPGLVALYDIRPGNGAGQFLQPRSPHGAILPSSSDVVLETRVLGSRGASRTKMKVLVLDQEVLVLNILSWSRS